MTRSRIVLVAAALAALLGLGSAALAFWNPGGDGDASAAAGTLTQPGKPTATPAGATVELSWQNSTLPGGGAVAYHVERSDDGGSEWADACGSTHAEPIGETSCTDAPGPGTFSYRVTARFASWSTAGPLSDVVSTAQPLHHFTVAPNGVGRTAGEPFSVTVTARDAGGNAISGFAGTVSFSSTDAAATLPADYAFTAADAGSHAFTGIVLETAGSRAITVTSDGRTGTATYTVVAATPAALAFEQQPANTVSGAPITPAPAVRIEDAYGNRTSSTASVSLSLQTGTGTLSGTKTVSAVDGLATFPGLSVNLAGSKTLRASSGPLTVADSAAFVISAGAAAKLAFVQQPTNTTAGAAITPAPSVEIRDAAGNRTSSSASVTVRLQSGTGTLSGTATVAASDGLAAFAGLSIDRPGAKTLRATSGVLEATDSASFTIAIGPPAKLAWSVSSPASNVPIPCSFTCEWSGFGNNTNFTARVNVTDAVGNIVSNLGTNRTVTVTRGGDGGAFTSPGTGNPVVLTISGTGAATSTASFTFRTQSGNWTADTLTAHVTAPTNGQYTDATATLYKN